MLAGILTPLHERVCMHGRMRWQTHTHTRRCRRRKIPALTWGVGKGTSPSLPEIRSRRDLYPFARHAFRLLFRVFPSDRTRLAYWCFVSCSIVASLYHAGKVMYW